LELGLGRAHIDLTDAVKGFFDSSSHSAIWYLPGKMIHPPGFQSPRVGSTCCLWGAASPEPKAPLDFPLSIFQLRRKIFSPSIVPMASSSNRWLVARFSPDLTLAPQLDPRIPR
jgi:hypothetical protein